MTRRLLNLLTALSLLLCVAVVALWVRSYHVVDHFEYQRVSGEMTYDLEGDRVRATASHFSTDRGTVEVGFLRHRWNVDLDFPLAPGTRWVYEQLMPDQRVEIDARHSFWNRLGWGCDWESDARGSNAYCAFPLWFASLAFATPSAVRVVRQRQARRRPGRCRHCGYDLRATPDKCPECGVTL